MKARILILITKADIGGAQIHVLELMRGLQHRYDFILALGEEDYLSRSARRLGIEVFILSHLVRPLSLSQDVQGFKEIRALIKQTQPDLVHAHSSKAGVLGRLAARSLRVPVLFTAHGWAFTEGAHRVRRIYGWFVEFVLAFISDGIVTISSYDTQLARRFGVGLTRPRWMVRNCVGEPKSGDTPVQALPTIINIGRLSPVKNQVLLLEALALVVRPYQAWLIGEGDQRGLIEQKLRQLSLEDKVALLGEVEDCDQLLGQADLFVLSSNYEGLPLSVLEAMAAGLPVVATSVGGVPEAVIDGQTGYLVQRLDAPALAQAIENLLMNQDKRRQMGEAGYDRYQQYFRLERLIKGMQEVYQQLLDKQR